SNLDSVRLAHSPYHVLIASLPIYSSSFFSCYAAPRDLPSFPTRRSSDLRPRGPSRGRTPGPDRAARVRHRARRPLAPPRRQRRTDRKSTRLNSSHVKISYAVFCLKKKKLPTIRLRNVPRRGTLRRHQ